MYNFLASWNNKWRAVLTTSASCNNLKCKYYQQKFSTSTVLLQCNQTYHQPWTMHCKNASVNPSLHKPMMTSYQLVQLNKFQWNLNENTNIFSQKNAFEYAVCPVAAMLVPASLWVIPWVWHAMISCLSHCQPGGFDISGNKPSMADVLASETGTLRDETYIYTD